MYVSLEWLSQLYSLLFNSAPDINQIKYNVYTFLSLFNFLGLGHGVNLNYWLCIPFKKMHYSVDCAITIVSAQVQI